MKISICSPSYKRPVVKTLQYIKDCKIYVDGGEYEEYKTNNGDANIIRCDDGIQGNVARVRNYILDTEFENGADAVCIVDDDLFGLFQFKVNEETKFGYEREKITDIYEFVEKYSVMCEEAGLKLWGVNLNKDSLAYRQTAPFSFNAVILGPFCVHLKNEIRYDCRLPLKEDYDMALQHLNKYRGILRVNYAHYDCLQSENTGGCATMRNVKKEKEQFDLLQRKWGSKIVKQDISNKGKTSKIKPFDYNPIIKVPIKGI